MKRRTCSALKIPILSGGHFVFGKEFLPVTGENFSGRRAADCNVQGDGPSSERADRFTVDHGPFFCFTWAACARNEAWRGSVAVFSVYGRVIAERMFSLLTRGGF